MFDIEEVKKILSDHEYEFIKQIGSGSFSAVFLCSSIKYQDTFAIKRTHNSKKAAPEFDALIELNHPNIIKFYESFDEGESNYLVMEYCNNGTIKEKGKLDYKTFVNYAKQILSALAYCHSKNIAHRDIKPDNIFLDKYDHIKIADFGLAKQFNDCEVSNEKCGSLMYCAPELLREHTFNPFIADVWSLGITFYYMATGTVPFQNKSIDHLKKVIMMGQIYFTNSGVDSRIQSLIIKMTALNPFHRPSFDILLNSPIFSQSSLMVKPRASNVFTLSKQMTLTKTSIYLLRNQSNQKRKSAPKISNLPLLNQPSNISNSVKLLSLQNFGTM